MADELALARSFYSWIAKIQINESLDFLQMPTAYSTNPAALKEITHLLSEQLRGTKYAVRARYWQGIFENSKAQPIVLDESARRAFLDFMKVVFLPRAKPETLPSDSMLMKMCRAALKQWKNAASEYSDIRKGQWSYQIIADMYRENDLTILANSLDYTIGSEDDVEEGDRHKLGYKFRIWAYALFPSGPKFLRRVAEMGDAVIGNGIALLVFFMRKAFGDAATKKVVNEVLQEKA